MSDVYGTQDWKPFCSLEVLSLGDLCVGFFNIPPGNKAIVTLYIAVTLSAYEDQLNV